MPTLPDGTHVLETELPDLPTNPQLPPSTGTGTGTVYVKPPKKPKPSASDINGTASEPRTEVITGIGSLIPVVYGRSQVQGQIIAAKALANGTQLQLSVLWCLGQVQEIERIDAGEKLGANINITGGVEYWYPSDEPAFSISAVMGRSLHYLGTTSQGVDPWLAAAIAGYADTNIISTRDGGTAGVAYSSVTLYRPDKWQGFPRLSATIKGARVYDPRLSGGAGGTAYSDNPALILADFINNSARGLGQPIDWDSVDAAADYCDEIVTAEKRRLLGITIDREAPAEQWIETLRAYAGCIVYRRGNEYVLIPDKAGAVAHTIAASSIVDKSMQLRKHSVGESPTVIRITWTDTTKTIWQQRETDPTMLSGVSSGTVPWRESRVSLPGIQRYSQAKREAIERLNYFSLQDLEATFEVFDVGLKIEPGDIISVTHPIGLTSKQMRVLDIDQVRPGRWKINALEYDPAVYSNTVVAEPTYPDTTLQNPGLVPTVTGLTVFEEVYRLTGGGYSSRFRASWTPVDFGYLANYALTMIGGGNGRHMTIPKGTNSATIEGITQGVSYLIGVYAVSTIGATGAAAATNITCQGKLLPPGDVPRVDGFESGGVVYINWDAAVDIDLVGYEVRIGTVTATWDTAGPPITGRILTASLSWSIAGLTTQTWKILIKAVDSVGNYSTNAAYCFVDVTQNDNKQQYFEVPLTSADINAGATSNIAQYTLPGDPGGIYYCSVGPSQKTWATAFPLAMSNYSVRPMIGHFIDTSSPSVLTFNNLTFSSPISARWYLKNGYIIAAPLPANTTTDISVNLTVVNTGTGGSVVLDQYFKPGYSADERAARGDLVQPKFIASAAIGNGGAFIIRLPGPKVVCDASPRSERGSSTSLTSGGKQIFLTGKYSSIDKVTITPAAAGNYIATYDSILVSGEVTNYFYVHIYQPATTADTSTGLKRVAVPFTWEMTGY